MTDRTLTLEDREAPHDEGGSVNPALCRVLHCDDLTVPPVWIPLDNVPLELARGSSGVVRNPAHDLAGQVFAVDDVHASRPHARLLRTTNGLELIDLGSKNGTFVDGERVRRRTLHDGALIEVGRTIFLYRAAVDVSVARSLPVSLRADKLPSLATAAPVMAALFSLVERVAPSTVPVLLLGETGTGKEAIARRVHSLSRRAGSFIAVNCGALPADLVESELFGARRGAYSGSVVDRAGFVRSAAGGTLFLDEVGDLPLPAQAALLRVLQEREVVPVGSSEPIAVDFRLIAATHRDLTAMVQAGAFRQDLRARLAGVTLELPALRHRREDVGLLLSAFAREHRLATRLSVHTARMLLGAPLPGNVRALQRAFEGALVRATDPEGCGVLEPRHFPELFDDDKAGAALRSGPGSSAIGDVLDAPSDDTLGRHLRELLTDHHGNVAAVARALGKQRTQVYRWIARYRLAPERFR